MPRNGGFLFLFAVNAVSRANTGSSGNIVSQFAGFRPQKNRTTPTTDYSGYRSRTFCQASNHAFGPANWGLMTCVPKSTPEHAEGTRRIIPPSGGKSAKRSATISPTQILFDHSHVSAYTVKRPTQWVAAREFPCFSFGDNPSSGADTLRPSWQIFRLSHVALTLGALPMSRTFPPRSAPPSHGPADARNWCGFAKNSPRQPLAQK